MEAGDWDNMGDVTEAIKGCDRCGVTERDQPFNKPSVGY